MIVTKNRSLLHPRPAILYRDLSPKQILEAYKFQPRLEKRLEQLKSVEEVREFSATLHALT